MFISVTVPLSMAISTVSIVPIVALLKPIDVLEPPTVDDFIDFLISQ